MPNTVHGPYSPTSWVNGTTALNATHMANLETEAGVALASFNPDLFTPFVESGITCIKDGVTANQLDIASGEAYVKMTDGTLARIDVVSDNTHTTVTPSTTYHLYLQPDGTWYWSTSNSPQANSLAICNVATDGSGNISTVTDLRTLNTTLLPNMAGDPILPGMIVNGPSTLDTGAITTDGLGTLSLPGAAAPGAPSLATAANTTTNNYKTFLLSLSPTRYYRLDETSGTVAADSSTANQAGTYVGAPTLNVAGALDGDSDAAITVNGTTQYVNAPTTSLPTGNGAITLGVWFKFSSNPAGQEELISYGTGSSRFFIQIDLNTSGQAVADTGSGTVTSGALSTGVWHFAVATWDGTTLKLYIDGVSVGTPATPGAQTIAASGNFLRVGANVVSTPAQFFAGSLDEAFVVNSSLTATNVSNLYTIGTNGPDSLTLPGVGTYKYFVTFANATPSETQAGTQASITTTTGNQKVNVSSIPLGPHGTTKRNLYRTVLNGSAPQFLATLSDNTTTTYADSTPDSGLGAAPNPTSGGLSITGTIEKVGGQATTGPFGVPVVVARAVEVNISTTTLTAVLSYTPTAAGLFRICASFCCNNGGTNKPLLHIDNTGGSHGQTSSVSMTSPTGAVYDGSSTTVTANFDMATTPQVFYCAGGAAIILRYQNSTGTPNDFVSFVIEQL